MVASAWAQGFDGTYKGERSVTAAKGEARYCGTIPSSRALALTVTGDRITTATWSTTSGTWSSKIAADGSFRLSGSIGNADQDIVTITGRIAGTRLQGTWEGVGKRVTCSGEVKAERSQ